MNAQFLKRMQTYLGEEYEAYLQTLQKPAYKGLTVNTLKISLEKFMQEFPYEVTKSPFCKEGFYLASNMEKLGNDPYHMAGAFYLQEPSASSVVDILDVQENDWVLDMCAAPGGKSGQIARRLNHTGFLLSNEYDFKRAQILLSNMERLGVGENAICSATAEEIAKNFQLSFDKVLVDAPCSGEGMLKKHNQAMHQWSEANIEACAKRQLQILRCAYKTLKPGGILVYSTCTYAIEENEAVIASFLKEFTDMKQMDCNVTYGRKGLEYEGIDKEKLCRIFPMDHGEGHFIAKLQKQGSKHRKNAKVLTSHRLPSTIQQELQTIVSNVQPYVNIYNDRVYTRMQPFVDLKTIKVLRQGVLCGEIKKHRIEPHHHLFMSASYRQLLQQEVEITLSQYQDFQRGNILAIPNIKGYVGLSYKGCMIGFGKGDNKIIKNKYPKGLRRV